MKSAWIVLAVFGLAACDPLVGEEEESDASTGASEGTTGEQSEPGNASAPTPTPTPPNPSTSGPITTTASPTTGPAETGFAESPGFYGSSSGWYGSSDSSGFASTGPGEFCGNGFVEPGEQCDGDDLQGLDCTTLGLGFGELFCDPEFCTFDTSDCMAMGCGDGIVQPGEQCDGENLQGFDCASLGLGSGDLSCDPEICVFDTSGCNP